MCLEAPPSDGEAIYLKVYASSDSLKINIYSDQYCQYELAKIESKECAEDLCCKMHAYSQGQDITKEVGDMYLKYDDDCTPAPAGITNSADDVIMKNIDARSAEMRSFISKTVGYSRNRRMQTTGYSSLVVGCLFLVGMVAGSGITAAANRSGERYSHLPSVEHTAMSSYQTSSVSQQSVNDL